MANLLGTAEINLTVLKENDISAAINPLIKTIQSLLQEMQQASPICFNNTGVESAANR